jgi:molybdopterin/thiamine biosynthesis adenylyltransferase
VSNDLIFSRERLAGYDPDLMGRSAALIVGAGALGQNTAQNLALAGIGEIRIVDKDSFEDHNRTRSPFYPLPEEQERLGLSKARVVAYKAGRLMTAHDPVMRYAHAWIQELGDGAFKGVSVVLSCVDNPAARAYLSDKARFHGIPFIEGGFEAADINLSCFPAVSGEMARISPCWRCSNQDLRGAFSCDFYAAQVERAGVIPAIQNAAAILAGFQAEAAILSIDSRMPMEFCAMDLNIRTSKASLVNLSTDPKCPGVHCSLDKIPIGLAISAEDAVKHLFEEITRHFKSEPIITFYDQLVWSASCTSCNNMMDVRSPQWYWMKDPRCRTCEGSFPVLDNGGVASSSTTYKRLTYSNNSEVFSATCKQIGLPAMSIVEAIDSDGCSQYFELKGSIDDLFSKEIAHE